MQRIEMADTTECLCTSAGRLKWRDVRKVLLYLAGLSWRLVCLVRYVNPVHYAWRRTKAPNFSHVDLQGVYYPTFKERARNYFKTGKPHCTFAGPYLFCGQLDHPYLLPLTTDHPEVVLVTVRRTSTVCSANDIELA